MSMPPPDCTWYRNGDNGTPRSDTDHSATSDEESTGLGSPMSLGGSPPPTTFCITGDSVFCAVSSPSEDITYGKIHRSMNTSLQIGRRSRAMGLKDIDLSYNQRVEYLRQAREVSRSPSKSKKHIFTPMRLMMSPIGQISSPGAIPIGKEQSTSRVSLPGSVSKDTSFSLASTGRHKHQEIQVVNVTGLSSSVVKPSWWQTTNNHNNTTTCMYHKMAQSENDYCQYLPQKICESDVQLPDELVCDGLPTMSAEENPAQSSPDQTETSKIRHRLKAKRRKKSNMKRRSNVLGFSDDEDDDEFDNVSVNEKVEPRLDEQEHEDCKIEQGRPVNVFSFCKLILLAMVLIIGVGLYVHINPHSLCLHGEFRANLTGLEQALEERLYGQHLAKKILVSSLKSHFSKPHRKGKPLVFSLHGWTGIGKNFVSGIVADHLFKHGSQSPFVHKIIIPFHFAHESEVELYRIQLSSWIRGNVSRCKTRALFIFDEMDKIPLSLVHTFKSFLDHRGTVAGVDYSNTVFLFLSNSGGNMINQHILNHYRKGSLREQIRLRDLEVALRESGNSDGKAWYDELLVSELIDHLVPFLPLERSHVKQCIRNELLRKGYHIVESLVTEIADQMSYFPPDLQLFSRSGCKKVSSRVDVAIG